MAYKITADDIRESLRQQGIEMPGKEPTSFLEKAGNLAGKFNEAVESSGLPNLGAHILSAPLHLAANAANVPGEISNKLFGTNVPKVEVPSGIDPAQLVKGQNSPQQRALGLAGDVIGDLTTGGGVYKGLEKALGVGAKTPLYLRSLLGGAEGAALSDPEGYGGRGLGAAVGAALPSISGVTKSAIGKRAAQTYKEGKEGYKNLYEKILGEGEAAGASEHVRVPQSLKASNEDIEKLFKHSPSKYNASVRRYASNPTLENAHKAQSDLGKIFRELEGKKARGHALSSGEHDAISAARDLQKRIRGAMHTAFEKAGKGDLSALFGKITHGYARDVVPFKGKEMERFLSGKGKSKAVAKELLQSPEFAQSEMASKIPGYAIRKAVHEMSPLTKGAAGLAGVAAAHKLGIPVPYWLAKLMGS